MAMDTSFLPITDLLRSGRMSSGAFLLQQEAADRAVGAGGNGSSIGGSQQQEQITMENAARVALLIAKSLLDFLAESLSVGTQEDAARHASELQLNDVFVNFEGDGSVSGEEGTTAATDEDAGNSRTTSTLLGVEIISPLRVASPQSQQQPQHICYTPLQTLGKLLYSTFALGETPPFQYLEAAANTTADNERDEKVFSLSFKSPRAAEESLFSRFVDSKMFPVSVCRLLADLMGSGPNGKAEDPFATFDEAIQDLEQMVSNPQMFLHDVQYHRGPVFGQVYHGRKEEIATLMNVTVQMEHPSSDSQTTAIESVFISGIAGSGKSALVKTVGTFLTNVGWTVFKAKFERDHMHASRGILLSMFDGMISNLVEKKDEGSEREYIERVSKNISDAIESADLSRLETFLPSLSLLFDEHERNESVSPGAQVQKADITQRQLVYSLTKILEAVLEPDRYVMLCCDDLQWADITTLSLLSELLVNLGSCERVRRHCLFVGLFRGDEVSDEHPFLVSYSLLKVSSSVKTSEIKLSTLSKDDVAEMLMSEFRLPRRLVDELAGMTCKKTAGHAFYIVELLNSLLSDSVISYSPQKRRYNWDPDRVDMVQPGENAAEFIARRVSHLPPESQRILHVLSCFGIQTDTALLQLLDSFQPGIVSSLATFIERGILDRAGPIVIFTHDIIQQSVYESMTLEERQLLQLEVGLFLGTKALSDDSLSLASGSGQPDLGSRSFYAGRSMESPLLALACDNINAAGPDAITDQSQRGKFAEWNLQAGEKSCRKCNFCAAIYYFSKGIEFLGEEGWLLDSHLCLSLHNGAVAASFSLGEHNKVAEYAQTILENALFADALEAQTIYLSSLGITRQNKECIAKGTSLLQKLGFTIPASATKEGVVAAMAMTTQMASQYSQDRILLLCDKPLDSNMHSVVKILDACHRASYALASPLLPLISCEIVKVSLQFGVCQEATTAFASYALSKIALEKDYEGAQHWATIVRAIAEKNKAKRLGTMDFDARAHILLFAGVDIWFRSPRDISTSLLEYKENASRTRRTDLAIISLRTAWRYKLLGGEQLGLILQSQDDRLEEIANYDKSATKFALMDCFLLLELTGKAGDYSSVLGGTIRSMDDLQRDAESRNDKRILHHVHVFKMLLGFWKGDYLEAEKSSELAWTFPKAKKPELLLIYHTFFHGLVVLRLYRDLGDDKRLKAGSAMMDQLRSWTYNSMAVFENKWQLLKAEYMSSFRGSDDASHYYLASIKSARDNGNVHELALAQELLGNYYASRGRGRTSDAMNCYMAAYVNYISWGATNVAERLATKHKLAVGGASSSALQPATGLKRDRG